jgi:uncharacterized lipoprotein YajG
METIMKRTILLFSIFLAVVVSSCGPALQSEIALTTVPEPLMRSLPPEYSSQPAISIGFFRDVRQGNFVVRHYESLIRPTNSVTFEVEDVIRRTLVNAGYLVDSSAPVVIRGEIREWLVDIRNKMPATLNSRAVLFVEVIGPNDKRIYSGVYRGTGYLEKVVVENKDVQFMLNAAMTEAVAQIMADSKLLGILSSF